MRYLPVLIYFFPDLKLLKILVLLLLMGNISVFHKSKVFIKNDLLKKLIYCWGKGVVELHAGNHKGVA